MRLLSSMLRRGGSSAGRSAAVAVGAVAVASVAVFQGAHALPQGAALFVTTLTCPDGWLEYTDARGRLVISVTDATQSGVVVGTPLSDQEDRAHTHTAVTGLTLPSKSISAAGGCCNYGGGSNGYYESDNTTDSHTSGAPFQQLLLCEKASGDDDPVPFGTVVYFTPSSARRRALAAVANQEGASSSSVDDVVDAVVGVGDSSSCPVGFATFDDAVGRALVPSSHAGPPVTSPDPPLQPGEDRVHSHTLNVSVDVPNVGYAAIEGCCNGGPTAEGTYVNMTLTAAESHGIPYIQLLTCYRWVLDSAA
jgi:hypothetical protein